ncbi:MAG: hypothetical protein JXO44_10520 [Clostridia bacterium]|nr:hypothetical protein [Clostridia bacterium]
MSFLNPISKRAVPSCRFVVLYSGVVPVGYNKISNIKHETAYDTIVQGGQNGSPVYLIKPQDQAQTITFSQSTGVISLDISGDILGAVIRSPVPTLIFVRRMNGDFAKVYAILNPLKVKDEWSDLDAHSNSEFMVDKTFVHEGLVEIPMAGALINMVKNWFS